MQPSMAWCGPRTVTESAEVRDYLVALARNVEGITSKLPAAVQAVVSIRHGAVHCEKTAIHRCESHCRPATA